MIVPTYRFSKLALMTFALDCEIESLDWLKPPSYARNRWVDSQGDGYVIRLSGAVDAPDPYCRIGRLNGGYIDHLLVFMRWPTYQHSVFPNWR